MKKAFVQPRFTDTLLRDIKIFLENELGSKVKDVAIVVEIIEIDSY
jgi:hypothetical protein